MQMQNLPNQNLSGLSTLTAAAVLVPLVIVNGEVALLFTKRTDSVSHHKGQICFPGGVQDAEDLSLWHTALREMHEELGVDSHHVTFLAELPKIATPTGFHVTPFVGYVDLADALKPSTVEIADVFNVPLTHLLNKTNLRFETRPYFGEAHQVPFYTYGEHVIWGATGRMILHLTEKIGDRRFVAAVHEALPEGMELPELV